MAALHAEYALLQRAPSKPMSRATVAESCHPKLYEDRDLHVLRRDALLSRCSTIRDEGSAPQPQDAQEGNTFAPVGDIPHGNNYGRPGMSLPCPCRPHTAQSSRSEAP